ncbi:MAG TPA: sodium:proline symporter [Bacteroidales bacterium]|jgi:sodium/proline symporter|nr:sodium:proline symporter [Bacteroidales bacterium]
MSITLIGFIVYLIAMMCIGIYMYRRNESNADYFLGGRKMNSWVVALSERSSGESAWLLLGLPGAALALGVVEVWTALGCLIGIFFYWFAVAEDIRRQSERFDAITLPDVFSKQFSRGGLSIRFTAMLIIIFFFTFYLAAQFNGAGKVLNVTFGIDPFTGMVLGAAVIILYTMLGGFHAVVWTDFIQALLMFGALVLLPLAGLLEVSAGGHSLGSTLDAAGGTYLSITGGKAGWAAVATIIGGLSWAFGYMGQPHLLTKFMSLKDPARMKKSRRIAFFWAIPAFAGAFVIGLVGLALYGHGAFDDVEKVMPQLANNLLPAWVAGILISAAIAAMMSTADGQLLVISSVVSEDLFHNILNINISSRAMVNLSRIVTLVVGLAAFAIAVTSQKLIFAMVSYAWSGLGASFGPALLLLLKWRKTTWQGVLAGMLTGSLSTIIWSEIAFLDQAISVRFASFVLAFAAVWLVSLCTYKRAEKSV